MTDKSNAPAPVDPLVEPIAIDALPQVGRTAKVSDADRALADAIAAVATNGNAANLITRHSTREDAEKASASVKRLVKRAGVVPEGKIARAAIVPDGDAFRVAIHFGEPVARKPKGEAAAS